MPMIDLARMLFQFLPELITPYDVRRTRIRPPLPDIDAPPFVYLCLNSEWASFVDGVCERLLFEDVWEGTPEEVERAIREIERFLATMSCFDCGGSTAMYRYNAEGRLEKSTDGGQTWEPADNEDPRFNSPVFPPLPGGVGETTRCLAAANAVVGVEELINQWVNDWSAYGNIAQMTAAFVAFIAALGIIGASGGTAAPAVVALFAALVSLTPAAVSAAMTPSVYDTFRCILYCAAEDDGSWTVEGWEQVKSEISSNLTGAAHEALWNEVNGLGPVGLTNLGRINRAGSADCSDCSGCEWCYTFDFATVDNGGFERVPGYSLGTYVPGEGWAGNQSGSVYAAYIRKLLSSNSTITYVGMTVDVFGGITGNSTWSIRVGDAIQGGGLMAGLHTYVWSGSHSANEIRLNPNDTTQNFRIKSCVVRGKGANPFGQDNCPQP